MVRTMDRMSPNRSASVITRSSDATTRRDDGVDTAELDRLVGSRRPSVWGNPKLAIGGGLAVLVALVALGASRVNLSPGPADSVAQPPVDVTPAPDDAPEDTPAVTALPNDPIGSDRDPGSPGFVEPVAPRASDFTATADCSSSPGTCVVTGTVELNVSAARLEAVAGDQRVPLADPGTAGVRAVSFSVPEGAGCMRIEAFGPDGKSGGSSNELCFAADGSLQPTSSGQ